MKFLKICFGALSTPTYLVKPLPKTRATTLDNLKRVALSPRLHNIHPSPIHGAGINVVRSITTAI